MTNIHTAHDAPASGTLSALSVPSRPGTPPFNGVPPSPDCFIGRSDLVDMLVTELTSDALPRQALSLAGPAGAGKSALAIMIAHHPRIHAHFDDGVLWAGLGQQPDVMAVLGHWARALGLHIYYMTDPDARSRALKRTIGRRRMLIVLDDAVDLKTAELLRCGGPNCSYLLTTLDSGLAGDFAGPGHHHRVPELSPDAAYTLLQIVAPQACAAEPELSSQVAGAVGGLPFALKLLGGYLAAPEHSAIEDLGQVAPDAPAIAHRRLLVAQQRLGTQGQAQATLQQTIALSLTGLPAPALRAFRKLGAFAPQPATFSREAAAEVAQISPSGDASGSVLDLLIAHHLLEETDDGLAIDPLLSSVASARADTQAAERHRAYYLAFASEHRDDCDRIETIYGQIRQAWSHHPDEPSLLEYAWALRRYHERRGLHHERLAWSERCMAMARAMPVEARKTAGTPLSKIGVVYDHVGQRAKAVEYVDRALNGHDGMHRSGNYVGLAATLHCIGGAYDSLDQPEKAITYYSRALALREKNGDRPGAAVIHYNLSFAYRHLDQYDQAIEHTQRAADMHEELGNRAAEAIAHYNLAILYHAQGQLAAALDHQRRAVEIDRLIESLNLESDEALLAKLEAELAATSLSPKRRNTNTMDEQRRTS